MTEVFTSWKSWQDAARPLAAALPGEAVEVLEEAVAFAVLQHGDQLRPTGVPYLEHLLEALEIAVVGAQVRDPDVLVAIVLHDVVEDTPCTRAEIAERFGEHVAELVAWVTKPGVAAGQGKAAVKAAYLRALASAPPQAVLVKLADRVSNVQELHRMPVEFQRRYHRETVEHIVPLAASSPWFARWFAGWRDDYRAFE
ncbi:HD domain-containing protein [Nonomuraea sp. NEAU-A123]|uniref:HD domain-containing protein n=1 Tax=Nonomuraea sp. NEAU-A123 TaxID=2839649 RepID=UPI0027DEDDD5|nr:HD domain-containing protein [Nonomuraea sp. NEAU-A123]